MVEDNRLKESLENSFLAPLLSLEGITDISYNGEAIYYKTNSLGRRRSDIEVSKDQISDFLRQVANLAEKQFSYLDPVLDVNFDIYRLSATFHSLARVSGKKSYSFALRIASRQCLLEKDPSFFYKNSRKILLDAVKKRKSIVIGGPTGAGKTELQKYLLGQLDDVARVIVIDNVSELELTRGTANFDLTTWLVDDRIDKASYASLIRTALRYDPDYLLLAESRGEEMLDALHCAMAGRPIITTIHSFDLESMPYRMARMAMMAGKQLEMEALLRDILHHFPVFVYVDKTNDKGRTNRKISSIGYADPDSLTIKKVF